LFYLVRILKFHTFIIEFQQLYMETKNFKIEYKSTQLISILSKNSHLLIEITSFVFPVNRRNQQQQKNRLY
jgi:hypothetical protein